MRHRISLVALLAAVPLCGADSDLLATYGQFRKAALDPARVAVAENLTLQKNGAKFQFTSGALYALEPVLDQVAGVVFVGDGVFTMAPPSPLERAHLARFISGQPHLEEAFKEAVFFFSDASFKEFSAGANFKQGGGPQSDRGSQ